MLTAGKCVKYGKKLSNESCKEFVLKCPLRKASVICKNCKSWQQTSELVQSRLGVY